MGFKRPVDEGVKPAGSLIPLDLVVPQTLGIFHKPGPDTDHLIRGQSLDSGGDLFDCAHGHHAYLGRMIL
jgi:hypothetical protein